MSSAELVSRYCSVWTRRTWRVTSAPRIVADIAQASIRRIGERARAGNAVDEHEVTRWIMEAFDRRDW